MAYYQYIEFINTALSILKYLIVLRVFVSFISQTGKHNIIMEFIFRVTEPLLLPFRVFADKINFLSGIVDFSPLLALLFIEMLLKPIILFCVQLII